MTSEALIARFRNPLRAFVKARVVQEDAEDIVQDVFCAILEKGPSLSTVQQPESYLYGIAKNRIFSYYARKKREVSTRALGIDVEGLIDPVSEIDELIRSSRKDELTRCLSCLPSTYYLTLTLYLGCDDLQKIAATLHIEYATVRWRLHKGIKLIKKLLENEEEGRSKP